MSISMPTAIKIWLTLLALDVSSFHKVLSAASLSLSSLVVLQWATSPLREVENVME
jgi:hypothetical protein